MCTVQAVRENNCLAYDAASKYCYKAQESNLVLLLQTDCEKIPSWLAANSKAGAIEGRYEFLGSSGFFSLHLGDIFNVPVIVFDGQYLLQLYID